MQSVRGRIKLSLEMISHFLSIVHSSGTNMVTFLIVYQSNLRLKRLNLKQ